ASTVTRISCMVTHSRARRSERDSYSAGAHESVAIDIAGSVVVTLRPFHSRVTLAGVFRLFNTSLTISPRGLRKVMHRTPFRPPVVVRRTNPGRTNLLKCAK